MNDKQSWQPSDEEIEHFLDESGAVLKIASATVFPWEYLTETIQAVISRFGNAAVEKALAEQRLDATKYAKEIVDTEWAARDARHKREVIEAKIDVLDDLWHATKRDDAGRTVESAFASHVTPDFIREEVARLASELAALGRPDGEGEA